MADIVIGNTTSNALSMPWQTSIHFDGRTWAAWFFDAVRTNNVAINYYDTGTSTAGTEHKAPYLTGAANGYSFAGFKRGPAYNDLILAGGPGAATSDEVAVTAKDDGTLSATNVLSTPAFQATDGIGCQRGSVIYDANNYIWKSGNNPDGANAKCQVQRSVDPFVPSAGWETAFDAVTGSSTVIASQTIAYPDGAVGLLYARGGAPSSLYYRHLAAGADPSTGWGSEDTVVSANIGIWYTFRGVVTRNGKLVVVYLEDTSADLRYRIYTPGTGWGTDLLLASDYGGADTSAYFSSMTNLGEEESVLAGYWDGTNIVTREWNGTSWSGKTTRKASPSFANNHVGMPLSGYNKGAVVWHESGSNDIIISDFSLTPTEVGTAGVLVSGGGQPDHGTAIFSNQVVSYGDYSLIAFFGRDHRAYLRWRDDDAESWLEGPTPMSEQVWDHHHAIELTIDSSGYAYYSFYGRATSEAYTLKVIKSDYPISDTVNFSLDLAIDWTDISPTSLTVDGGYKQMIVDQADVVYLILAQTSDFQDVTIREYRSASWSSPTTLLDITATGPDNDLVYVGQAVLGKEPSGQKSISFHWTWRDGATVDHPAGSVVNDSLNYMKVIPQGTGSFKKYRADGVELTGTTTQTANTDQIWNGQTIAAWAASTVVSAGDFRRPITPNEHMYRCTVGGTTHSSEPTFPTDHFDTVVETGGVTWEEWAYNDPDEWQVIAGGIAMLDADTPLIATTYFDDTATPDVTRLTTWKWNGTTWVYVDLDTDIATYPDIVIPAITVDGLGDVWVIAPVEVSGIKEIKKWYSDDDAVSFDSGTAVTTGSSFDNSKPRISPRSGGVVNLLWIYQTGFQSNSEVRLSAIEVGSIIPMVMHQRLEQGLS